MPSAPSHDVAPLSRTWLLGFARAEFDSREYGSEYISLRKDQELFIDLSNRQGGWAEGFIAGSGLTGWFPANYWKLDEDAVKRELQRQHEELHTEQAAAIGWCKLWEESCKGEHDEQLLCNTLQAKARENDNLYRVEIQRCKKAFERECHAAQAYSNTEYDALMEIRAELVGEASAQRKCMLEEQECRLHLQRECIEMHVAQRGLKEEMYEKLQAELRSINTSHQKKMRQYRQEIHSLRAGELQFEQECITVQANSTKQRNVHSELRAELKGEAHAQRECSHQRKALQLELQKERLAAQAFERRCKEETCQEQRRFENLHVELQMECASQQTQTNCLSQNYTLQTSQLQCKQEFRASDADIHQENQFRSEISELKTELANAACRTGKCTDTQNLLPLQVQLRQEVQKAPKFSSQDLHEKALPSNRTIAGATQSEDFVLQSEAHAASATAATATAASSAEEIYVEADVLEIRAPQAEVDASPEDVAEVQSVVEFGVKDACTSHGNQQPAHQDNRDVPFDDQSKLDMKRQALAEDDMQEASRDFMKPSAGAGTIQKIIYYHPAGSSFEDNMVQRVRNDTWVFLPVDIMITSNDRVPLTMLLQFLSKMPEQLPFTESSDRDCEFHVVVPLALKVNQTLSGMQKKFTGGVSGHWAALNFNFRTRRIEFFDPKGDSLEGAGSLGGVVPRPTQFVLCAAAGANNTSNGKFNHDELLWRTYAHMKLEPWWKALTGSDTRRLQPKALVELLKHIAGLQAADRNELAAWPFDLSWLETWGFNRDTPVGSSEKLQFDHESCPSFAVWFALERGSEGKQLTVDAFVASMKAKLLQLSGSQADESMSQQIAEKGISAWRRQLANSLIPKL